MLPDYDSVSLIWVVTSDPLSRCVGGLPLLKEAGPKSLEWGGVAVAGGAGGADVVTGNSGLHGNLLHQ